MALKSSSIGTWREILGASTSRLINTIGVVLLIVILNTELSVEEIGLYFFLFAIVDLLSNIAGGLGKAIRKRVSAREGKQSDYLTTALVATFAAQGIIVVLISIFVLIIPKGMLPDIVDNINMTLLFASLLLLITQSTGKILLNYNSGLGHPSRSEWLGRAFPGVLFFVLTVAVVYFGLDVSYVFFSGAISYSLSAIFMMATTRPDLTARPSIGKFKSIIRFGKWSIPNKIVTNFYGSLDLIILGALVTSTAAGYYESTNNLSNLAYVVPFGVGAVLSVKISGLDAEGKTDQIRSLFSRVLPISMALPVAALSVFIIFGEFSIEMIYGNDFVGAYIFLVGLSVKEVITSYRQPVEALNYGMDMPQKPFYANISAVALNIITVIPLVIWLGGIGVVVSTILAEILRSSMLTYLTPSNVREIRYKDLLAPFAISLPISLVFWSVKEYLISMNELVTSIYVVSFIAVYLSVIYITYSFFNIGTD